jgi:Zn-dependent protease with chaperone function
VTAWHLLLFAALATTAAPAVLRRARWVYRSPLLGIIAWYSLLSAVLLAVVAATASLLVPWRHDEAPVCVAWRWCLQAARGEHGTMGRFAAAAVVVTAALLAVRLVVCAVQVIRAGRRKQRQHLQLLQLAGRDVPELGAMVIDSPQVAAYMVSGHHRQVVVTTGAIAALRHEELAAVLAHERAHAAGRHDVLLNGVRLLHEAFRILPLFGIASQQLARLVEMRADEVAATQHRPISLARALVAMAHAGAADVPVGAVAATGGDAMARLGRLLDPPDRLTVVQKSLIGAGVLIIVTTPVVTLLASWLLPSSALCLFLPI